MTNILFLLGYCIALALITGICLHLFVFWLIDKNKREAEKEIKEYYDRMKENKYL